MRVSLVPDRLFETYEEITPEYLRQRGIRLLPVSYTHLTLPTKA